MVLCLKYIAHADGNFQSQLMYLAAQLSLFSSGVVSKCLSDLCAKCCPDLHPVHPVESMGIVQDVNWDRI